MRKQLMIMVAVLFTGFMVSGCSQGSQDSGPGGVASGAVSSEALHIM